MNDRMKSHGRAAWATLGWLHGRRPRQVSMLSPPTHFGAPEPKTRQQTEEAVKLLLAPCVGEMLACGGHASDHVVIERPEVKRAIELSGRLGPADPVDHLERCYDDLHATLTSPRVWAGVARLADTLQRERLLLGDRAAAVLRSSMLLGEPKGQVHPVTRRIIVVGEQRR